MATLRGEEVDRPPVSFYELNGLDENREDPDPFNIYSDPSWKPLLELTRHHTDRIVMRGGCFRDMPTDPLVPLTEDEFTQRGASRYTRTRLHAGSRVLTTRTRRDTDVNSVWTEEHLLKDEEDLKAYLKLPMPEFGGQVDTSNVLDAEEALGDAGIVMLDNADPLCLAASLFNMADYTVIAMTEPDLFHGLLERFSAILLPRVEALSKALPGRLWRIYGPEYASEPYLPPSLFKEYVCRYDRPLIEAIHRHGGFARIHSHGRLSGILDYIATMDADGLDPIEPPPQGDMSLAEVGQKYGSQMVLFGNLEISDIENMPTPQFRKQVQRALKEGTGKDRRGFVLMPSACPYGRKISSLTLRNYETIIEVLNMRERIT